MIEVPVTQVGEGSTKHYEWDCAHCGRRMRSGRHGIVKDCPHEVHLKVRTFPDVVAVFPVKSESGQ